MCNNLFKNRRSFNSFYETTIELWLQKWQIIDWYFVKLIQLYFLPFHFCMGIILRIIMNSTENNLTTVNIPATVKGIPVNI